MKNNSYTCALVMVLLSFTTGSVHSAVETEKPQPDSNRTTAKLLERIDQLEKRVAELEKSKPAKITYTPVGNLPPGPPRHLLNVPVPLNAVKIPVIPKADPYPKGWKQKEINGMKYFIVPLAHQRK